VEPDFIFFEVKRVGDRVSPIPRKGVHPKLRKEQYKRDAFLSFGASRKAPACGCFSFLPVAEDQGYPRKEDGMIEYHRSIAGSLEEGETSEP
jgi:hypothetical protein